MPCFGAHMSIAGGCHNALLTALKHECEALQLFTKNNNQWVGKALTKDDAALFRRTHADTRVRHLVAHDCYLINLASPDLTLYRRSVEAFVDEMRRAEALGLNY